MEVARGVQTSVQAGLTSALDTLKRASGSLKNGLRGDVTSPAVDEHLQSALDKSR